MATDTKILAFGIVVGATILGIMYHLTIPPPALHSPLIPNFPVRSPPKIPYTSISQSFESFKLSIAKTVNSIIQPLGELGIDSGDPIVALMRKERLQFILHTQQQGVNITAEQMFRLFPPVFTCPYKEERLGGAKFGKWACGIRELYGVNKSDSQSPSSPIPNCVMYSFGVGPEVAFDEAVLKITNCKVFAYDHTVQNGIPSRTSESKDPRRMAYQKIGVEEYRKQNSTYLKSIKELMGINGHDWMDILKVDVETAEWGSLNMLMDDFEDTGVLPFDQFLVEVHVFDMSGLYTKWIPWFNRLEAMGLRVVHAERNPRCACYEYLFVNVRGKVFHNSTFSYLKNGWSDMKQYTETPPPSSSPNSWLNWF